MCVRAISAGLKSCAISAAATPGLFINFGWHPDEGRGLCGLPRDLCIFFLHTDCNSKMHRSFTAHPPRPAKKAGRKKEAGATFRMTTRGWCIIQAPGLGCFYYPTQDSGGRRANDARRPPPSWANVRSCLRHLCCWHDSNLHITLHLARTNIFEHRPPVNPVTCARMPVFVGN
jgi:hypothetical protein